MSTEKTKVRRVREERADFSTHRVGEIVVIDDEGRASVTFPGNHAVPVPARSVVGEVTTLFEQQREMQFPARLPTARTSGGPKEKKGSAGVYIYPL